LADARQEVGVKRRRSARSSECTFISAVKKLNIKLRSAWLNYLLISKLSP